MKFGAIADIHGNLHALEAVLADIAAQGIADVVNLGDHVSGPLAAAKTADLLMALDFVTTRGDQDRRLLEAWLGGWRAFGWLSPGSGAGDVQRVTQSVARRLAALQAAGCWYAATTSTRVLKIRLSELAG